MDVFSICGIQFQGSPWKPDSIDVLYSRIKGYSYKGSILGLGTLGYTDHAFSPSNRTEIVDAQIYENANYYYYGTGSPGSTSFDCDRVDGVTGLDYLAHVMHELGHAIGLKHTPKETTYQNCLLYPSSTAGRVKEWCTIEVYTLSRAYGSASPSGIVYAPPLSGTETQ